MIPITKNSLSTTRIIKARVLCTHLFGKGRKDKVAKGVTDYNGNAKVHLVGHCNKHKGVTDGSLKSMKEGLEKVKWTN